MSQSPPASADRRVQFLGEELRTARLTRGLTTHQVVRRLPGHVAAQTLTTYELGSRRCTVTRLLDLCDALEVSVPDLLAIVIRRAHPEQPHRGVTLDLHVLARSDTPDLLPLRRWAITRLRQRPDLPRITLTGPSMGLLAVLCGVTEPELMNRLAAVRAEEEPGDR